MSVKSQSRFRPLLVPWHVHEKHICCWSDNSKTKYEWETSAMILIPFYVTLLAIVKNNLITAWYI